MEDGDHRNESGAGLFIFRLFSGLDNGSAPLAFKSSCFGPGIYSNRHGGAKIKEFHSIDKCAIFIVLS